MSLEREFVGKDDTVARERVNTNITVNGKEMFVFPGSETLA